MIDYFLLEDRRGVVIFQGVPIQGNYPAGLGADSNGIFDTIKNWFLEGNKEVGGIWRKAGDTVKDLIDWVKGVNQNFCVADCGTFYVINIGSIGAGIREIPEPGNRLVIQADQVPGWISPCRPAPTDQTIQPGSKEDKEASAFPDPNEMALSYLYEKYKPYLPYAAGAGLLLILLLRR